MTDGSQPVAGEQLDRLAATVDGIVEELDDDVDLAAALRTIAAELAGLAADLEQQAWTLDQERRRRRPRRLTAPDRPPLARPVAGGALRGRRRTSAGPAPLRATQRRTAHDRAPAGAEQACAPSPCPLGAPP